MSTSKNYYEILGVPVTASQSLIKSQYRKLALLYHPDKYKCKDDQQAITKFNQIQQAYETLSNPEKKNYYDFITFASKTYQSTPKLNYRSSTRLKRSKRQLSHLIFRFRKRKIPRKQMALLGSGILICIMAVLIAPYLFINLSAQYHYEKGVQSYQEGEYYQALNSLNQSIYDMGSKNVDACLLSGRILIENLNQYSFALKYINKGLGFAEEESQKAELYYLKGKCLKRMELYINALNAFETSLQYLDDFDSTYYEIGELNTFVFKNYEEAISNFNQIINLNPEFADAYLGRGYCYQQLGNHQKAIDDFNAFEQYNKMEGMAYFLKALSQIEMDQKEAACENLKKASILGITESEAAMLENCISQNSLSHKRVD
jgi:tetratricopeptide (TPR) repeat protein